MTHVFKVLLAGTALSLIATPGFADVKSGVDAWERGDFATAVNQWRPLAVKGDADAQFNLAQAYRFGRGVPADMRQAEEWYRRAATQGHLQAEDNLGLIMFQNGNTNAAMPIIERSANRGEARAQYVYGTALFNGDTIQKDWPRAYAFMTRASASGLSRASSALAQMDQFIPLDQRQQGMVIARQLEAQASQAKFARAGAPQGGFRPPVAQPQVQPRVAATNYPPVPMPQQAIPSVIGSDPYVDSPAIPATSDTETASPRQAKRGQILNRTRGALPSPRRTQTRAPAAQQDDLPQVGAAGEVPSWNGQQPAASGGLQPVAYPGDPAGYPQQSYPQQTYPQQSYPQQQAYPQPQAYPQQSYPQTAYPVPSYPAVRAAPRPAPVRKPQVVQVKRPVVAPAPAPVVVRRPVAASATAVVRRPVAPAPVAASGAYRIQLGAFSTPGGADSLWKSLRGRVAGLAGKQPYLVKAGSITRLQAGGYASRADAERACSTVRSSGNGCVVVGR